MREDLSFLDVDSGMARRIREFDWSATRLGPIAQWPVALRHAVALMLRCRQPAHVAWGDALVSLYNDEFIAVLGDRHPRGLGQPAPRLWGQDWDALGPITAAAMAGQSQWYPELPGAAAGEGWAKPRFNVSITPLLDDGHEAGGVLWLANEVRGGRRSGSALATETERQRSMFAQAPGFICSLRGREHVFEFVNESFLRLFGERDFVGRSAHEAFPDLVGQGFLELLGRVYESGERFVAHQVRIVLQDDNGPRERYLEFVLQPLRDEHEAVASIFIEGYDVTERVAALSALSASEDRYRQIVEGAEAFAIITQDENGLITSWNTGAQRMMGYAESEVIGRHGAIFFTDEDCEAGEPQREMRKASQEGRAANERWHVRKDGSRFWGSGLMMRLDGSEDAFLKMFHDRTQQHAAEARLARRSEQQQALARTALEVTRAPTLEATLEEITRAAREVIGAHQAVVSLTRDGDWSQAISSVSVTPKYAQWNDYGIAPDRSGIHAWICEQNQPARLTQTELEAHPHYRGSGDNAGQHLPMRGWLAAPLVGRDGRNLGLIQLSDKEDDGDFDEADEAMLVQLAQIASAAVEQASTDSALRRSEEQLRLAIEAAEIGMWDLDLASQRLFWQPRVKRMFGLDDDAQVSMDDFYARLHPDDRPHTLQAVEAALDPERRALYDVEYRALGLDGVERWVAAKGRGVFDENGACVRMLGTTIDITARKRIEAQLRELNETLERRVEVQIAEHLKTEDALRQSQKMEAVGQLTGGIAHDFNNVLGAVVGSFDLIRRKPDDTERVHRFAEAGLKAAERGAKLTGQLLAFARAQQLEMKPLRVSDLVLGMRDMLTHALGPMVHLDLRLDEGDTPVMADPTQLEMAVLNLSINARDAMPKGGTTTLATRLRRIDDDAELAPGQYVELAVADTGSGMDQAVAARAFEPFFTTKGVGKGTGLGLSQVYGIAHQAGGSVRLESRPGMGTTVRILLPRTAIGAEPEASPAQDARGVPLRASTVLVVDDDANLRGVLVETLEALGYRVLQAEDGPSGLATLANERPDLLMLDFAMPGMNGAEVARHALARHPDLPIMFATGYADTAAISDVLGPRAQVLRKPFRVSELQAMLDTALDQHG
jgi:PAS domain S-box-containing protein